MEIDLVRIDSHADVYDVRNAVALVLHGEGLYDPNENGGRRPTFEVEMGRGSAGRIHNGKATLRVASWLGVRLLKWYRESNENNIVVNGHSLKIFNLHKTVPRDLKHTLENALYIDPEQERIRAQREDLAGQFGVWYKPSDSANQARAFSAEYERVFFRHTHTYISVVYEHKLIHINIGQRETEEFNYMVLVKFSSIRKLGLGYDESGQAFIIFDLYAPPNFEQERYDGRASDGIAHQGHHWTRDRISAIDEAHARIAPYAHHLRILLEDPDDLLEFEKICHTAECQPCPVRVPPVDAQAMQFFSTRDLNHVRRWIKTLDWRNAFQIEGYLRCGLLNTHDLLVTLRQPIDDAIEYYGPEASEFLRLFSVALRMRKLDEDPSDCFSRVRANHVTIRPLQLPQGYISTHYVIITPSKILVEGPYPTESNRVIRHYQSHEPTLVDRFVRVEFRDEDRLAYRHDGNLDGTWFLQERVGGILRHGFELGGRTFELLAYSTSMLRDHSVWFVSPFRDPQEGFVTAEKIRSSLGDFSGLLRKPSKYAARTAQAFTATGPGVKIRRDQWEEQDDLGTHTDGVGTISPELADMIWEAKCNAGRDLRQHRVKPSAYPFRFLGYRGVVVVDHQLEGIKMRLRPSQRRFPVHGNLNGEAVFEITGSFDHPYPAYLNRFVAVPRISEHNLLAPFSRPTVMALEDRGVNADAFLDLQEMAKASIDLSSDSLENFSKLLTSHNLGGKFHLAFIVDQLNKIGLDFKDSTHKMVIKNSFFERLLRYSMHHSLREVKFKARIPVPNSYQLVGVADEGRAYIKEGVKEDDVFTLKEGSIYVCVQESEHEPPIYLEGACVISRSPAIHPGDVQRVWAVGEPPEGKKCFFRGLKNVVVLPAVGQRSLASCLAGGDLDGDTYDVYYANPALIPTSDTETANYESPSTMELDHDIRIEDICDFIVEYINNDIFSLLVDRHIVTADQSKEGVFDDWCMELARLCTQVADFAKSGHPVDIHGNLPKPLIKFKPDWHKAEVTGARELDYYVSDRALGLLFRNIELNDPDEPIEGVPTESQGETAPVEDAISRALAPLIQRLLNQDDAEPPESENGFAEELHARYVPEMRYICITHTLIDAPEASLKEEEVVLGTILSFCTQPRWRAIRSYRMRLHAGGLVIRSEGPPTEDQLRAGLLRAWAVWVWAQHHRELEFIESLSLIMLGVILDCLKDLGGLAEP
ncbi:RNA dependent RNA polymerase-domain-containing protein [Russula compacta]|nr:RNA dependent RNA polymerase-domain-containing protein [Russula compacta]